MHFIAFVVRWLDYGPGLEVDLAHLGVPRAKLDAERVRPIESLSHVFVQLIQSGTRGQSLRLLTDGAPPP